MTKSKAPRAKLPPPVRRLILEATKACADLDPSYDDAGVLTGIRKALKAIDAADAQAARRKGGK